MFTLVEYATNEGDEDSKAMATSALKRVSFAAGYDEVDAMYKYVQRKRESTCALQALDGYRTLVSPHHSTSAVSTM